MTICSVEMDHKEFNDYVRKLKKNLLIHRNEINYTNMAMAKCLHVTLNLCSLGIGLVFIIFPVLILYNFPEPCIIKVSPCLYRFTLQCIALSGIALLLVIYFDIRRQITVFLDIHILAAAAFFIGAVGAVIITIFHPQRIGQCMIWKYAKKQSFLVRSFVDLFQNNVECCGAISSNEWLPYGYLPTSCCYKLTAECSMDNIHPYSCIDAALVKFGSYLSIIAVCFLVMAACPGITAIIAFKKLRSVKKIDVTSPVD